MGDFLKIFKKVNGLQTLKQYAKSRVLILALCQTAILGTSKKSLEIVRLAVNNRIYMRLKRKNKKFITSFKASFKEETIGAEHADIIWVCWLQGMENAPNIVQKCYTSLKEHIKNKEIIVVTENNYRYYVSFPDYILKKYQEGKISKAHFADLLRIELLYTYGGTWIDATVYCSGTPKQEFLLNSNLFLFQNLKPGLDGDCAAISNWFITASTNNPIILLTRSLLHNYWRTHNYVVDYFIFHYFFQMALETYPQEWEKVVPFSNSTPHILLLRLFEKYDKNIWNAVKEMTDFHKLSYKFEEEQAKMPDTYYQKLFGK